MNKFNCHVSIYQVEKIELCIILLTISNRTVGVVLEDRIFVDDSLMWPNFSNSARRLHEHLNLEFLLLTDSNTMDLLVVLVGILENEMNDEKKTKI